jgi:hypothetical protein
MNNTRYNADLGIFGSASSTLKSVGQNLLVTACYHVLAHGNTDPINRLLKTAQDGKAVDISRITKWVTLHAQCCLLRDGVFVRNEKVCKEQNVTDEASFAKVEEHLRSLNWTDITGKTPAKNPWDIEDYLASVLKQLEKHEKDEGADTAAIDVAKRSIKEAKGKIALASVAV